jgi:hypothetical protein
MAAIGVSDIDESVCQSQFESIVAVVSEEGEVDQEEEGLAD